MLVPDALSIAKDFCTVLLAGRFACSQLLSSHAWLHAAAQPSRQCQGRHLERSICIPMAPLGHAVQFALPLTGSTPTATLSLPTASDVTAVAVDSAGNVAVGAFGGSISIFNAPITGSASASATFKNGTSTSVDNLAFNSAGDLFATTNSNSINVFTHPFTSASTPSQVIACVNLTGDLGIVLDFTNNLIVSNSPAWRPTPGPAGLRPALHRPFVHYNRGGPRHFLPPNGHQRHAVTWFLLSAGQLYQESTFTICRSRRPAHSHLPSPTAPVGSSVTGDGVAVDSSGNLYAGLSGNTGPPDMGTIRIYVPPFSGASAPNVTTGVFGTSLAIGK